MLKKYGILAYPAGHSLSPAMHNAAFKALELEAEYRAYEVGPEELEDFMNMARSDLSGLSVSLPYKEIVIKYLDEIDENAGKIGAVNTIVNQNGFLLGYNTDFTGSNRALKEAVPSLKEKIAVIAGAGGAARAIAYGLLMEGAHIWIKNRTKVKADQIALEFAELFDTEIHSEEWDNWQTGDIFINATSFWLQNPDISRLELPEFCSEVFLKEFSVVMDISYNAHMSYFPDPLMTPLLLKAKELGLETVTGDKMLLHQAEAQFQLWTGKKAPTEDMALALKKALGSP